MNLAHELTSQVRDFRALPMDQALSPFVALFALLGIAAALVWLIRRNL